MDKIRNCPLCGGDHVMMQEIYLCDGYMGESPTYLIKCCDCGINLQGANPEKLLIRWNMRIEDQLFDEWVAALVENISKAIFSTKYGKPAEYDPDEYLNREI